MYALTFDLIFVFTDRCSERFKMILHTSMGCININEGRCVKMRFSAKSENMPVIHAKIMIVQN